MSRIKKNYYIGVCILLCLSCEQFVEVGTPPNSLSSNNTFNEERSAIAAVVGIYTNLSGGFLSANMPLAMEYYDGSLIYNGSADNFRQFANRSLQADNSLITTFWNGLYQNIYYCNAAIKSLYISPMRGEIKNQLLGECLFLRAFCYSFLVDRWGAVPLILTPDWEENQSLPRFQEDEVYKQIIADLEEAKALLMDRAAATNHRANYYSASALLSRIYLRVKNWQKVDENASALINDSHFNMEDIGRVFLINSDETIFQFANTGIVSVNTTIGRLIIPSSTTSIPNVGVATDLLSLFAPDDLRQTNWLAFNQVNNTLYYYPFKYKESRSTELKENLIGFRLAEQFLNRAFARLMLGQPEQALKDLNAVRSRATTPAQTITVEDIEKEMKLEFFCEWALASSEYDRLWPIPVTQIQTNPFLVQNPNY